MIEDFHFLRVDIKKLRAYTHLFESFVKKFKRDVFIKPYKKVFAHAGTIREIQIELKIIEKLEAQDGIEKYIKGLNKKLNKLQKNFDPAFYHDKIKSKKKKIKPYLNTKEKLSGKSIESYFETKWGEIDKIIRKENPKKSQLHDLRKKLKEFFYNIKIIESENKIHEDISKYMDYLGQWHDYDVLLENIEIVLKKDKTEKKGMNAYREKVLMEERKLYQKIKQINTLPKYTFQQKSESE
jgi:CHAD domain-containing protein